MKMAHKLSLLGFCTLITCSVPDASDSFSEVQTFTVPVVFDEATLPSRIAKGSLFLKRAERYMEVAENSTSRARKALLDEMAKQQGQMNSQGQESFTYEALSVYSQCVFLKISEGV